MKKLFKIKLSDIFLISNGNKKYTTKYNLENKGIYPIYSSKTLNNGIFAKINTFDYNGEYITMSQKGTPGVFFYRNNKFSIGTNCVLLTLKKKYKNKINLKYIFLLLKEKEKLIQIKMIVGSVIKEVNLIELAKLEIEILSISNQKKISNALEIYWNFFLTLEEIISIKKNIIKCLINSFY